MPRIPTVLAEPRAGFVAQQPIQGNAFEARALGSVAEGLGRLASTMDKAEEDEARLWAAKTSATLRAKVQGEFEQRRVSGQDLTGFGDWVTQLTDSAFAEAAKTAPNARAPAMLELDRIDFAGDMALRGMRAEADYRVTKRLTDLGETLDLYANEAYTNPDKLAEIYARGADLVGSVQIPYEHADKIAGLQRQVMASGVAGMVERDPYAARARLGSGEFDAYLDPRDRAGLASRADAEIRSREAELRRQNAEDRIAKQLEAVTVRSLIQDDLASIERTGQPLEGLEDARVIGALGPDDALKWQANRTNAANFYLATRDLGALPTEGIQARLDELRATLPEPGTPGYADAVQMYDRATQVANETQQRRMSDPAAAVNDDPAVREARAAAQAAPDDAAAAQALVQARIAAQRAFLPAGAEQPLTTQELKDVTALIRATPIEDAAWGQRVDATVAAINRTYGDAAPLVLKQIAQRAGFDPETADMFAGAIYDAESKTLRAPEQVQRAADNVRAEQAVQGMSPRDYVGTPAAPRQPGTRLLQTPYPNWKQIQLLRSDPSPEAIAEFDEAFGQGAAQRYLALPENPQ